MRLLVVCIVLACLAGCGATIYPPVNPANPTTVYVTNYGRHSSLMLPAGKNEFDEYAFGDWEWFVLNHKDSGRILSSLLFSKRSGLGRKRVSAAATQPADMQKASGAKALLMFDVNADRAAALKGKLDSNFDQRLDTLTFNSVDQMYFVESDRPYHLCKNCNQLTANWLESLGCRISGAAMTSQFKLAAAP